MDVAVITGGSRGLGFELATALAADGCEVVIDGRSATARGPRIHAVPGDVRDAGHRADLIRTAEELGELRLLINNASTLGPSPQPSLAEYPLEVLREVYEANVIAPVALTQLALPALRRSHGTVVDITSDAAVEGYAGWGGYGSSKAALEKVANVLAAEESDVRVVWFDPSDMRTQMHQEAFPGEDISDRPLPATVVPVLLGLLRSDAPSGRYRAADLRVGAQS